MIKESPGTRIAHYTITQHLASGGMADVYLADEEALQRQVALKIMHPNLLDDPQFVERFQREARTVAKLDHPNIVQIYMVGTTPERPGFPARPFLAMRYIDGQDLSQRLTATKFSIEQSLQIVRQIASALVVAHHAGIVHRDLKPSNVIMRPDDIPVLVDLGIAQVADDTKLTRTGGIIGTLAYMSPEQMQGKKLDGRSDLYSLGIILYELLAGIRPFTAESSVALMHQIVYEEPIPIQEHRPDLPPEVAAIVTTCLQKHPDYRYQCAEELIAAIDHALRGQSYQTAVPVPPFAPTPAPDQPTYRRYLLPAIIIVGLFCVVGGMGLFMGMRLLNERTAVAATAPPLIVPTALDTPTPAETAVVITQIATLPASSDQPPTATPIPTPENSPTPDPTDTPNPTATPFAEVGLADLGSNQLAYASNEWGDWAVYVLDLDSGQEVSLIDEVGDSSAPVWSPDGRQLAYHAERNGNWDIYVLDTTTRETRRITTHPEPDFFPTWSPDGTQIAFHTTRNGNYDLYSVNTNTLQERPLTTSTSLEANPDWSPDGTQLLFEANYQGTLDIYVLNLSDLSTRPLYASTSDDSNPEWSPDGTRIAFSSKPQGNAELFVMDSDGRNPRQLTSSNDDDISYPTWSPDGSQIIFELWPGAGIKLYIINADGSGLRLLYDGKYRQRFPSWLHAQKE